MIRERDAVLPPPFRKQGQQMTYDGYDKAPCDLYAKEQMQEAVDQITQIQEQNTYLDKVASNLQDLCDKQAKMLADRDAVLRQALEALERTETYLRIEVNEAYGRDAHVSTITEWQEKLAQHKGTIAAINGVLDERPD
jgi:hypothetical protein